MTTREAFLLLILILIVEWALSMAPIPTSMIEARPMMKAEKARAEKIMRYHGIDSFVCDAGGCWFERDGGRVRI